MAQFVSVPASEMPHIHWVPGSIPVAVPLAMGWASKFSGGLFMWSVAHHNKGAFFLDQEHREEYGIKWCCIKLYMSGGQLSKCQLSGGLIVGGSTVAHPMDYICDWMRLYAIICDYMRLYAIICDYMRLYAIICDYMLLYAIIYYYLRLRILLQNNRI